MAAQVNARRPLLHTPSGAPRCLIADNEERRGGIGQIPSLPEGNAPTVAHPRSGDDDLRVQCSLYLSRLLVRERLLKERESENASFPLHLVLGLGLKVGQSPFLIHGGHLYRERRIEEDRNLWQFSRGEEIRELVEHELGAFERERGNENCAVPPDRELKCFFQH